MLDVAVAIDHTYDIDGFELLSILVGYTWSSPENGTRSIDSGCVVVLMTDDYDSYLPRGFIGRHPPGEPSEFGRKS